MWDVSEVLTSVAYTVSFLIFKARWRMWCSKVGVISLQGNRCRVYFRAHPSKDIYCVTLTVPRTCFRLLRWVLHDNRQMLVPRQILSIFTHQKQHFFATCENRCVARLLPPHSPQTLNALLPVCKRLKRLSRLTPAPRRTYYA